MANELILKIAPVGVDVAVNTIQAAIFKARATNGNWDGFKSYHRAYRNVTKEGIRPEIFTGNGNEYIDAFTTDRFTVTSFFLTSPSTPVNDGMHTSDISIIFQVNLDKLYTTAPDTERFDEEFKNEIVNVLVGLGGQFDYVDTLTDLDDVYAGLDTSNVKLNDTHPYHVVRFELTANYMHSCNAEFATTPIATCDMTASVITVDETVTGANNGKAFAIQCSGTGPFTYAWTGPDGYTSTLQDITDLADGIYTVTITDTGALSCVKQASGTVAGGGPIPDCEIEVTGIVTTPPTSLGGNDGMALATVIGNAGGVNYRWSNGETTNPAVMFLSGSLTVGATDSGVGITCIASGVGLVAVGDAGASDFIEAAGITGTVQINALTQLVIDLKGEGSTVNDLDVWTRIYALYPYCPIDDTTATREAYKWNLVNPLDTDAAFRINWLNSPVATVGGIEGNGTNQYGDTHFAPTVDALSIDDFGISMRNTTTVGGSSNIDMGCSDNSNFIQLSIASSSSMGIIGTAFSRTSGTINTTTNRTLSRSASNDLKIYSNGLEDGSDSSLGGSFAPNNIQLLGRNHLGSPDFFSGRKYTHHAIHKGFTLAEVQDFNFAMNKYDTALGR